MDVEKTIAEIEWLERLFILPDTRPTALVFSTSIAVSNIDAF